MKFCPECGNPIEGCKFCPNCGYAVTNQPQPQPEQPTKKPVQSKRTDKIGPLEIDRNNRTYRIHGAQKAKGSSGMAAGAVKVVLQWAQAVCL